MAGLADPDPHDHNHQRGRPVTNDQIPEGMADLVANPDLIKQAFVLLRQIRNLKVILNNKEPQTIKLFPDAQDAVLDLRDLSPSGLPSDFALPNQTGHLGEALFTDSTSPYWAAAGGAKYFTQMSRTAQQTIATADFTAVSFDVADSNDFGFWDGGSPDIFTVPAGKGGLYLVSGIISYAANATGTRYVQLLRNGVGTQALENMQAIAGGLPSYNGFSLVLRLADGDYIQMRGYQDSGTTINMSTGGSSSLCSARIGE